MKLGDTLIEEVSREDYPVLLQVWEASVRATHHFLKEEDIDYFKPLILSTYFDAVTLRCIRKEGKIVAFLGVADQNLEMLFIHPDFRGMHLGKSLVDYAVKEMDVIKVDVNEQNDQAVGFYKKYGFEVYDRSEKDGTGKPYPLLHMQLNR